jgi:hypothetical protein
MRRTGSLAKQSFNLGKKYLTFYNICARLMSGIDKSTK